MARRRQASTSPPDAGCTYIWVRGVLSVNYTPLSGGDALKLTDTRTLRLAQGVEAEVLVFDLPGEAN